MTTRYRPLRSFVRTVGADPATKRLVPIVAAEASAFGTEHGQLCPDVRFCLAEDDHGDRYWAKRWLGPRAPLTEVTMQIEDFLRTLARDDLCLAVDHDADLGLIYRFDSELFDSTAITHVGNGLPSHLPSDRRTAAQLAHQTVRWPGLPAVTVGDLTDFQTAPTTRGMIFFDFEPAAKSALELAGVAIP